MSARLAHHPQASGFFIERKPPPNRKRLNDVVGTQFAMTYKAGCEHLNER